MSEYSYTAPIVIFVVSFLIVFLYATFRETEKADDALPLTMKAGKPASYSPELISEDMLASKRVVINVNMDITDKQIDTIISELKKRSDDGGLVL